MGSKSDLPVMQDAIDILNEFGGKEISLSQVDFTASDNSAALKILVTIPISKASDASKLSPSKSFSAALR